MKAFTLEAIFESFGLLIAIVQAPENRFRRDVSVIVVIAEVAKCQSVAAAVSSDDIRIAESIVTGKTFAAGKRQVCDLLRAFNVNELPALVFYDVIANKRDEKNSFRIRLNTNRLHYEERISVMNTPASAAAW
jgi:hypothetical protein